MNEYATRRPSAEKIRAAFEKFKSTLDMYNHWCDCAIIDLSDDLTSGRYNGIECDIRVKCLDYFLTEREETRRLSEHFEMAERTKDAHTLETIFRSNVYWASDIADQLAIWEMHGCKFACEV